MIIINSVLKEAVWISAKNNWLEKIVEHVTPSGRRNKVKVKSLPPEEREKYNPNKKEDGFLHTLKDKLKEKKEQFTDLGKKTLNSIKDLPENVKSFVTDKDYRKKTIDSAIDTIKKSPKAIGKSIYHSAKKELKGLKHATHAAGKFLKRPPEKLTKEDKESLYSAGVYVAGAVLGIVTGGGATFVAGATGQSFAKHVAIKAVSEIIDSGFLHFEAAETVAHALHVFASKDDSSDEEKLINLMSAYMVKHIKELSQEEIDKILKE